MLKSQLALILTLLFFFSAFTVLSIIKHESYLTGYDLAIVNQVVWKYSQLKLPITTIHSYAFTSSLTDHVELIYILFAPIYRIFNDTLVLLILQNLFFVTSGWAIYKLAKFYKLKELISLALLFTYFTFYGTQNALWSDVHSLVFGVSFLAWLIYYLTLKNWRSSIIFFILALACKEDMALFTILISLLFYLKTKSKSYLWFCLASILYLFFIFGIYFPYLTPDGYRYQNPNGLLSNLNLSNFANTSEKQQVILYSLATWGFLPIFSPIYLILLITDLGHYFVLGSDLVTSAQGLFMHYRISLALFLVWPTIMTISKFPRLNSKLMAFYLLIFACFFQYYLHLPLSYLSKTWFWTKPEGVDSINRLLKELPPDSSVVAQSNITPHISNRDNIFTLWPEFRDVHWAKWVGNPEYLIVDYSPQWDIRHYLANREDFINGIKNLENAGVIEKYQQLNTTILFKIK